MSRISVLIAQSDAGIAAQLRGALQVHPDMQVIGTAQNLMETYSLVEDHLPMVVVVAEDMIFAPEFEVMCALFDTLDVRWLVAGGDSDRPSQARAAPGATSGKADLFPIGGTGDSDDIAQSVRVLARAARQAVPRAAKSDPAGVGSAHQGSRGLRADRLILIGASTGGVEALLKVLSTFPARCPPTVVCQHTGQGFGRSLVSLLDHQCAPRVVMADEDMPLPPGTICIAAGLPNHAVVAGSGGLRVRQRAGEPVSGHRPSVDVLFRSALPIAPQTIGVLLTGMGRDGAEGLRDLREAGATTLAQDEASSVVFGMPRAARDLGAVDRVVGINEMGPAILDHCTMLRMQRGAAG